MDYSNDNEHWNWHRSARVQKDCNHDISETLWNGVPQNEEDLSYMMDDEATPVKACGDLAYQVNQKDNRNKEPEEHRESFSQVKRRRMLQFDTESMDSSSHSSEDLSTTFLKSNENVDSIEETFEGTNWVSGFSENTSASGYECLDESPNRWIEECFNDPADMQFSPDDLNFSEASDVQIDVTKLGHVQPDYYHAQPDYHPQPDYYHAQPDYHPQPDYHANVIQHQQQQQQQQQPTRISRNVIFRGRKSYIQTPSKLATSVAYPFAFIKPSGTHGAVTLKEINQRIRTPPPPKLKPKEPEPFLSAFSGKPVVGKTKIRTEGGKGSITIMRTKG